MKKQIELTPEQQGIVSRLPKMTIGEVAVVIRRNWKPVHFSAVPYLDAMHTMNSVKDDYGADSGTMIVNYFLGNATTWRGPIARAVKAELNKRLKG